MEQQRSSAQYFYIHGHQSFWRGNPSDHGSVFRTIVISSDQWNDNTGKFQVYAIEGVGRGMEDGKFAGVTDKPTVIFDQDYQNAEDAGKTFKELSHDSEGKGFRAITLWDVIEIEANARSQG